MPTHPNLFLDRASSWFYSTVYKHTSSSRHPLPAFSQITELYLLWLAFQFGSYSWLSAMTWQTPTVILPWHSQVYTRICHAISYAALSAICHVSCLPLWNDVRREIKPDQMQKSVLLLLLCSKILPTERSAYRNLIRPPPAYSLYE